MTPDPTFTVPSDDISAARLALARLQRHLERVVDPLDESLTLSGLALAQLGFEAVHPPYPPLPDGIEPSTDPRGDLGAAIAALLTASTTANGAKETLRLAYVIRDLRALERSPYLTTPARGGRV